MKSFTTSILILIVSCAIGQPLCDTTALEQTSIIRNNYRQNSTNNLAQLIYNDSHSDPVFSGNGIDTLFDIGYVRGIWVSASDPSGNLKVAASGYPEIGIGDYAPGPIWADWFATAERIKICKFFRRALTISALEITEMKSLFASGSLDLSSIPIDILEWPALGNPHLDNFSIDVDLAPFYDNNNDGIYDPLEGDYPIARPENPEFIPHQFRFYVINDGRVHLNSSGTELGIEFQIIDYVVNTPLQSECATSVFTRIKYTNKSTEDFRDLRIGIWDDIDIGCTNDDDHVGSSPSLNSSFSYNATGVDSDVNCDFKPVPNNYGVVKSLVFLNCNLDRFMHFYRNSPYVHQGDPHNYENYHNYLTGRWLDGTELTAGGTGHNPGSTDTTSYAFSGLPNDPTGWYMEALGKGAYDTRSVSTTEISNLKPGESGVLDLADHILMSQEKTGLDIFDLYENSIRNLKKDFQSTILNPSSIKDNYKPKSPLQSAVIFPNPSEREIKIGNILSPVSYRLYNNLGILYEQGTYTNGVLRLTHKGVNVIQLATKEATKTFKVLMVDN